MAKLSGDLFIVNLNVSCSFFLKIQRKGADITVVLDQRKTVGISIL